MSGARGGRVKKHKKCPLAAQSRSVLRMMAIMERANEEVPKEFLETGRTGRRNAMPDILQPGGAALTTADLPLRLQRVNIVAAGTATEKEASQASTSKADLSSQPEVTPSEKGGS